MQVCSVDLDGVGRVDQQLAGYGVGQTNGVHSVLRGEVSDNQGDEVLGGVSLGSPGLSEAEDNVGAGRVSLSQGVLLEGRQEVVVVVEDLGPLFLLQGVALLTGGRAVVHHGTAQGCGIDVVVHHLQHQAPGHRVEDVLGDVVGVSRGQHNLLGLGRAKEPVELAGVPATLGVLASVGEPAAVGAEDVAPVDRDGTVHDPDG